MSDSDSELLTTNRVFAFQNESTTVSARGPNINTSNLTGISFRHNVLTSTMNMPKNYERQRWAESNYDQRSISYRRETSPMSIASACDARQRNFNRSIYARGMSSQRSVYNGRGGSPMSVRSIDSNATMSSMDIAMALKTNQFNKHDRRIIQEALNKFAKKKARKRIEKKRNLKQFLKGYRRKSGYDSGEMASNSSISSDDDRSTSVARTANYKSHMSSCRSTKTDVADFRRTLKDSNMFNDCTDNFKQNRMQGIVANLNASRSSTKSMPPPQNFSKAYCQNLKTQQDRFKNGYVLPSQRFNRSVAALSIPEGAEKPHYSERNKQNVKSSNRDLSKSPQEVNSDDEEIFSELTAIERPAINQRKRSVVSDDDDICLPIQKKPKVASPCKNMSKSFKDSTIIEKAKNDFEFAKPAFPVRKSANIKSKEILHSQAADMSTTEKLICQSRRPLSDSILFPTLLPKQVNTISQTREVEKELTEKNDSVEVSTLSQNTSEVSMRPSFIKRKLFTQNMDVTEKTDVLAVNSPQNSVYGAIQKERNKARKLVTSQNCLKRDIQSDDNNFLDLIHKIVPAERMNATNQTNKTSVQNVSEDDDDKWDVTSIISVRNNVENVSDTFTDEETVLADNGKLQPSPKLTRKQKTPPKLVADKKAKEKIMQKVLAEKNGTPIKTIQKNVITFWGTDCESDAEKTPMLRKGKLKENKKTENIAQNMPSTAKYQGFSSMFLPNNTVDNIQKFNNKGAIQKDKNKAIKLGDTQSDDINLVDTTVKVVPKERIHQTNKIAVQNKVSGDKDNKCNKTSVLSIRNNDANVSGTFTDDDTVLGDNGKLQPSPKITRSQKTPPKLVTEKKPKDKITQNVLVDRNGTPMKTIQKNVITFWDTDFESDAERTPYLRKTELKQNKKTENTAQNVATKVKFGGNSSMFSANKTSIMNNTVDSVQKFNITNKSFRLYSHRNIKPIAKITAQEKVKVGAKSCIEPQSKKQKVSKASCLDKSVKKTKEKNKQENKKSPPKKMKTNKATPSKTKEKEPLPGQTSKYGRILRTPEKLKAQNKKNETVQSKPQKKKETSDKSTVVNKPQKKKDTSEISIIVSKQQKKKETSENIIVVTKPQKRSSSVQNKKEVKTLKNTTCNKTLDTSFKKHNNKRTKGPKGDSTQIDTTVDINKNNRMAKVALTRVPDNTFFKSSFAETNNNKRIYPIRSCRKSKENKINTSIRPIRSCRYSGHNESGYSR